MTLDIEFLQKVQTLRRPMMDTDLMEPLLYGLIRNPRPCRVLEFGMGCTTSLILRALAENQEDAQREAVHMRKKTNDALARLADGCVSLEMSPPCCIRNVTFWRIGLDLLEGDNFYEREGGFHLRAIPSLKWRNFSCFPVGQDGLAPGNHRVCIWPLRPKSGPSPGRPRGRSSSTGPDGCSWRKTLADPPH